MNQMKNSFILVTAMIMICSCTNNEITEINPNSQRRAIGFKTLRNKASTRIANENRSTYMVYATIDGSSDWYFNTVVTPNGDETAGSIDSYSGEYYWPGTTDVQFYAYCPAVVADTSGITSVTATYPDITIDYTVPTNALTDFTIATPVKQAGTTDGTDKAVAWTFNHMLSKIKFTAVLSSDLTSAGYKLNGPYPTGDDGYSITLTVPYNSGTISATADSPTWSYGSVTNTAYSNNIGYYFLPQTYSSDNPCTIQLKNVIITYDNVTFFSGDLETYTLSSTDISNSTFLMGTYYEVTITITDTADDSGDDPIFNGEIQFSSNIANWDQESVDITQP